MGGFEGGDEGGFWDEEALFNPLSAKKSPKRENNELCIKIEKKRYRLAFLPSNGDSFTVEPNSLPLKLKEDIAKAYEALLSFTDDAEVEEFFFSHKVLFSESSSSLSKTQECLSPIEAFLLQTKDACSLCLTPQELDEIAKKC